MSDKILSSVQWAEIEDKLEQLTYLQKAGVSGWHGYQGAMTKLSKDRKREVALGNLIQELNESLLVDGVEWDFPAGRDAGISLSISAHGESIVKELFTRYFNYFKELEGNIK